MSVDVTWNADGTIAVPVPKRPKKLTGTRFAAILGLNRWSTAFQVWCEVTKTYAPPFEDTKYTLAGKAIEPKQIQYMRESYGMDDLQDPTDVYGKDYFSKTYGNFFDHPVLGGMWDAITVDDDGKVTSVIEFKTTKRVEDWAEDVPEYYALQAALYAYLLGVDEVIMVCSFLEEDDYEHPEDYVPNARNTMVYAFKMSERYPRFRTEYVQPALKWWDAHVETGISPKYDEKADAEYLDALRTTTLNPKSDIDSMMVEYCELADEVAEIEPLIKSKQKRMDEIKAQLKQFATERIGANDKAEFGNGRVTFTLSKTRSMKVDEKALKRDGLYEAYAAPTESLRFNIRFNSEEE